MRCWLDCGLLVNDNILYGQKTLTSRKDMLAASSDFKYYVYVETNFSVLYTVLFFSYGACSPISGYGLLILEVSRSHTTTHHSL